MYCAGRFGRGFVPGALGTLGRMDEQALRTKSLWLDQLDAPLARRPALSGDIDVDVAIVGAGYTGLWTAVALLGADPTLRVLVVEREMVGFGASGRNGGWCVGELAGGLEGAIAAGGRDAGIRMTRAIIDTVDEVGRVVDDEGIDCGFARGGVIRLARTVAQVQRQRTEVDEHRHHGFGDDVLRVLDAEQAARSPPSHRRARRGALWPGCPGAARPAGARARRGRRASRRHHRRGHRRDGDHRQRRRVAGPGGHRARNDHRRRRGSCHRGLHPRPRRAAALHRPAVLTDGRHRTARRRHLERDRPAPHGDVRRRPTHGDLRPAHDRRATRVRRAGRPVPVRVGDRRGDRGVIADPRSDHRHAARTRSGRWRRRRSRTDGAVCSACRATGARRSASTVRPAWPGRAGTSARAWRRRIWPGARWPTSSPAPTPISCRCRGSVTDRRSWEPEPLRWLGINAGLQSAGWIDRYEAKHQRDPRAASVLQRIMR